MLTSYHIGLLVDNTAAMRQRPANSVVVALIHECIDCLEMAPKKVPAPYTFSTMTGV